MAALSLGGSGVDEVHVLDNFDAAQSLGAASSAGERESL